MEIEKLDKKRLKAIKLQAQYNMNLSSQDKFKIAMNHIEGLREIKRKAKRINFEKV